MKPSFIKAILSTVSALALVVTPVALRAAQPQMNEAIEHLREAKTSKHPVEQLEIAKKHLEEAEHNKHGERKEAIHQVNAAIEAAKKGGRSVMEGHIDKAIVEITEGKKEARHK